MECKYGFDALAESVDRELIDTLWNVNFRGRQHMGGYSGRINRYIMECKCMSQTINK